MGLPPPVIGRVPTMLTTDDCIYATAVEGKILDLKVTTLSSSSGKNSPSTDKSVFQT